MSENERLTRYHALSPASKAVLGMKSLIGTTTTQTAFQELLTASGLPSPEDRGWSVAALNRAVNDLQEQNLLDEKGACPPELLHQATADLMDSHQSGPLFKLIQQKFPMAIAKSTVRVNILNDENGLRLLRLAMYANDTALYVKLRDRYEGSYHPYMGPHLLVSLFLNTPVSLDWLIRRTPLIQHDILFIKLAMLLDRGLASPGFVPILSYLLSQWDNPEYANHLEWMEKFYLLSGDLDGLRRVAVTVADGAGYQRPALHGTIAFLSGDNGAALDHYRLSLKAYRAHTRKRKIFLEGAHGLYFLLALLAANDSALHSEIQSNLDAVVVEGHPHRFGLMAIQVMLWLVQGVGNRARILVKNLRANLSGEPLAAALVGLAEFYVDPKLTQDQRPHLEERAAHLREALPLLAHIYESILARFAGRPPLTNRWIDFAALIQTRQPWERAFESLGVLLRAGKPMAVERGTAAPTKRLAWFVGFKERTIEVAEQSFRIRQGWSEGRPVAMKRLYEQDPRLSYLTDQDRRALRTIRKENGHWSEDYYYFEMDKTLPALIGHPAVFETTQRTRPVALVSYPLELVVTNSRKGYCFALSHSHKTPTVFVEEETPGRYRVIEFSEKSMALRDILGDKGLEVPQQAREQVTALLREQGLSLPIRADLADVAVAVVAGDATPVVQLRPLDQGLKVALHVRPFGTQGPCYLPGQGSRSVLATLDGEQRRANRNLEEERKALDLVYYACPMLSQLFDGGYEGGLEALEPSLDLLLELQSCPRPLRVEWPAGKPLRVSPPVTAQELVLHVRQSRDWFQVKGEIRLDQAQVVAVERLLERLDQARGRFIPLEDGHFITLTSHFRKQLERLRVMTEATREGRRLAISGAVALQELVEESGEVQADRHWHELAARIREAGEYQPALPSTLQAELRDYQVEGFCWLSRLARWGAGACLADDMGLGKTVQTIAVMLDQAGHGPCLVVAPTSVCHNWEGELGRFAPVLTVHRLSAAVDRGAVLLAMGPMDVLVVSYGLLQVEEERLAAVTWRVLVLDEAQAIKNAETRRAQASRKLNATFRIALSGTPIENYLEELWSLFQVINPHLLGSRESFQKRFAGPIEKNRDPSALNALRALVRPFILRRTKSMVLAELPARTDVTLEVELPDDERAFHEALRQKALENLESLGDGEPGFRRLRILAEITRLRRAYCHPALVDPESLLPGAKLTMFLDLAAELMRNRHKALVFSQFVGQLQRVRAALDGLGIVYQYLDGGTPAREREKRVKAFQSGVGELFLISLKAGGLGLNLTAADYVIHLDPWWNPAVEDQASDRAHRIGQTRPVTVYRLIVRDSIEEKMLQLHKDKRDLADALLEGADSAVRLSEEDLLALLRG